MEGEEQNIQASIITYSTGQVSALKGFATFFGEEILEKIYVHTLVIHNLFAEDNGLDFNRLEIFHIRYTATLLALLEKIKKNREQQALLYKGELLVNANMINSLEESLINPENLKYNKQHGEAVAESLKVFAELIVAEKNTSYNFSWFNALLYTVKKSSQYNKISVLPESSILKPENSGLKRNLHGEIEQRLLQLLQEYRFNILFIGGFCYNQQVFEVFKIKSVNNYFVFNTSLKSFYSIDEAVVHSTVLLKKGTVQSRITQLEARNAVLSEKIDVINGDLSTEVEEILKQYYTKITEFNFMDELKNIDVQTNVLRAMLTMNFNG